MPITAILVMVISVFRKFNNSILNPVIFFLEESTDGMNGGSELSGDVEYESVSSARTRALSENEHSQPRIVSSGTQLEEVEPMAMVEEGGGNHDRLLKDVTAAADICRCNPCRCDPLLNDCSVSCNPVVDESVSDPDPPPMTVGGGCGCSKKGKTVQKKSVTQTKSGCGCNCGKAPAAVAIESPPDSSGELDSIQFPVLPCHPQETPSCSQTPDTDPCCIVVCLKHLKRQFLLDRQKCCA